MGGFFGERKDEILDLIPNEYLAKTIVIKNANLENLANQLKTADLNYPLIAKPIVGERGFGVRRVFTEQEIVIYASEYRDFLIQEFVSYEVELGLMFYKLPETGEVVVSSLASKEYLHTVGDGSSSISDLLLANPRNRLYYDLVKMDYPKCLSVVPNKGEKFIIHRIGNHVKGTRFINENRIITRELTNQIKLLVDNIDGVNYGRFDLKVPNYNDLEKGQNYKVFELNGVSSEPLHVYDLPNVFLTYYSLAKHWLILIEIAKQNIKKGVKITPFRYFLTQVKQHFA